MIAPRRNDDLLPNPPFAPIERVDVAICTWNRADLLRKTLDSIKRLIVPYQVQLRAVIVNNGSTDGTDIVLKEFTQDPEFNKRHSVVTVTEDKQGHTFARNRAIESFDSDLVIWTDDDVTVDAFLVQRYVEFADSHQNAAFFGGKIEPSFEKTPEPWITDNWEHLKGCFATRDLGETSVPFAKDCLPYGANFAIRTEIQKAFLFNVQLGRRGAEVHGEDELEMLRRVLKAGYSGTWVPNAKVDHFIDASRMTELYVRDYFVGQGRALVAKGEAWSDSAKRLKWRSLLRFISYRFKRQFAPSDQWVPLMIESSLAAGQATELSK